MIGLGMGLSAFGSLTNAYASYQSGHANAAIDRLNANYDRLRSRETLENGEYRAGVLDLRSSQIAGAQATSAAGQGVVAGAGSAGMVQQSSYAGLSADSNMIRLNARREAYGYEVAASSAEYRADQAIRAGNMQAVGSVLQGAGSLATGAAML